MLKKPDPARDRLVLAAMDARDLLRAIAPELGARRAEAEHVAELLKAALKNPGGSRQRRRNDAAWRSGGLWSVLEASGRIDKPKPAPDGLENSKD
jgi:hypothetical protein